MTTALDPAGPGPAATDPVERAGPAERTPDRPWWQLAAALGLAVAGGLHVAAAVEHLSAGQLAVGFFLLTALAQLGLAAWLAVTALPRTRPAPELVTMGVLGLVVLLGLYLVAHTTDLLDAFAVAGHGADGHGHGAAGAGIDPVTGVDFSTGMAAATDGPVVLAGEVPGGGHGPEALGTATVVAELLAVAALTALLPARWRRWATDALLALGVLAWVLWLTGTPG